MPGTKLVIVHRKTQRERMMSNIKVPPHNLEAEQAVLGGILINNDAMNQVTDILSADDFYRDTLDFSDPSILKVPAFLL